MTDRIRELEMRRRQLLLRSERLRAELAADQRVILNTLGRFDRLFSLAKSLASPLLMAGGSALLFGFLNRTRPTRFAIRSLGWITLARRALSILSVIRVVLRSRSARRDAESQR